MEYENYIGKTVSIIYKNPRSGYIDKRTGIVITVTIKKIAFLVFNGEGDEDVEIMIPIKNIKRICKPEEL